ITLAELILIGSMHNDFMHLDAQIAYLKTQGIEPLFIINEVSGNSYQMMKQLKAKGFTNFQLEISEIKLENLDSLGKDFTELGEDCYWLEDFIQDCKPLLGSEDVFNYQLNWNPRLSH